MILKEGTGKQFLLHQDLSLRLVEWLETLMVQGYHRVILYLFDMHPNMLKVN